MKTHFYQIYLLFSLIFIFILTGNLPGQPVDAPETYFGFKPGADRMLFDYEQLIGYLQKIDPVSPRLELKNIGLSPMGKNIYIAFVSLADNLQNLEKLREYNHQLTFKTDMTSELKDEIMKNGKIFVLLTLSMHATEVAPSQAVPLIVHQLITTADPLLLAWLKDVVLMIVPSHNPDGMDMVVEHYRKYKGTKYEGSSMPGVYHKYVGHDNNRDFITLSQSDNQAIARIYNQDWLPQVMVEKHQMGSGSARYFVPPPHDPIAENIPAELWNWTWIFGSNMIKDMTEKGQAGVSQHYMFDDYWPGSTETCIWKNVIGMLTECASVQTATPIYVEPNELGAYGKGLAEYKKSINMPLPWPGGWWRLNDMIDYEISSTLSVLKTASLHREEILKFRYDICRNEIKKGQTEAPFYYAMPLKQHDPSELAGIVNLIKEHGIKVYQLKSPAVIDGHHLEANDVIIPLAQPFRPFIKEVMEKQGFPARHYTPDGELIKPYDITSWSLPLHRGVKAHEIKHRSLEMEKNLAEIHDKLNLKTTLPAQFNGLIFNVNHNESFLAMFLAGKMGIKVERTTTPVNIKDIEVPRGSFLIRFDSKNQEQIHKLLKLIQVSPIVVEQEISFKTTEVAVPKIAMVETWFHDMDAGWTRFVFDSYNIPFTILRPGDFKKTDLEKNFDVIIFPDADNSILMEGKWKSDNQYYVSSYPPEFTKGIGKEGFEKLLAFLDKGGIIISWGQSTRLFSGTLSMKGEKKDEPEEFKLPFNDISSSLQKAGLYCPGSLMKLLLNPESPLTAGLPESIGVFFRGAPVFQTSMPNFDMDRRVIGSFPERELLLSGYCENEEKLGQKSAAVWIKKGKGQLVLFGFNPQFRASTQGAFKLLFNALLLPEFE